MTPRRPQVGQIASLMVVAAGGIASVSYVATAVWAQTATGLFVFLSVLAAALLVRLARPSPFSNPDVFSDANVEEYFVALREVALRLSVILAAVLLAVVLLVFALLYQTDRIALPRAPWIDMLASGLLGATVSFLFVRFVALVKGDLGFIALQRRIIIQARTRKAAESAEKIAGGEVAWKSAGNYGRLAG
jgi:hypothetical protein